MPHSAVLAVALGAALAVPGCVGGTPASGEGRALTSQTAGPSPAEASEAVPLPPAVARTRDRIVGAARQRDWAALDSLAGWEPEPGRSPFLYTLGPLMDSPAAYWRTYGGDDVLREMVAVLSSRPSVGDGAFGWPSWAALDSVPPEDRVHFEAALPDPSAVYTEAGEYVGPVTSIDSTGRWLYYVAGE